MNITTKIFFINYSFEGSYDMTIANSMIKKIHILKDTEPVEEAIELFKDLNIHAVPVIDENESLVGMVTKSNLYLFLTQPGHYKSCPISWVMSDQLITASIDESITDVAMRLRENHIFSLPVLDKKNVVGLITVENVLDYLLDHFVD